jgi:formylglycine-generating enzyme required for sulfatase activity
VDYLDFELEIDAGTGLEYPVRVINSPAGQARETMYFPFAELELQNKLQALQIALLRSGGRRRQSLSPEQQTVQDFGRALFDALLTGEVRVRYDVSLRDATLQGRGLRLKLRVNTPEMAALPWEFLYDPRRAEYVCLSQDTPILRYLELPQPIQPLTVAPPLRILGMVASPSNLDALNVDVEKQRVEAALRDLQDTGLVELTWLEGQTWRTLQQAMRRDEWHIFHFIGHGGFDATADEGLVMLCGEDGSAQRMTATQLGRLLANHRTLRLVLLNACEGATGGTRDLFSSTASILVRRGIPAVLAMQYPITDRAAIEFSRTFYESLVDGLPVDAAVVESRVAISLAVHNTVEWGTPMLYMRSADGLLFSVPGADSRKQKEQGVGEIPGVERGISKEEEVRTELPVLRVAQLVASIEDQATGSQQSTTSIKRPAIASWSLDTGYSSLSARQTFEPELILIPAGEFLMGSDPKKDKGAYDDEQPQHTLYLPDYWIAKMPVTNAQYAAFVQATRYKAPRHWKNRKVPAGKDAHPVVYVSWDDAMIYCKWLAEATGKSYTLPSEAEWEKAARGTNGRIYPWGNTFDKEKCNIGGLLKVFGDDMTPVDRYPQAASPYGVLDMAGNVWEWTRSSFRPYPYDPMDGREDISASCERVVRGGAFYTNARRARCVCRRWNLPHLDYKLFGFRVVGGGTVTPIDSSW